MKKTYLAYKDPNAEEKELVLITTQEWDQILKTNRSLPYAERRFFMMDCFDDCGELDCMYMEVSKADYDTWHVEHMTKYRERKNAPEYSLYSLDAASEDEASIVDTLADDFDLEQSVVESLMIEKLREKLSAWKAWAPELLDLYLLDLKKEATFIISERHGVSVRCAQKWKAAFEEFVRTQIKSLKNF